VAALGTKLGEKPPSVGKLGEVVEVGDVEKAAGVDGTANGWALEGDPRCDKPAGKPAGRPKFTGAAPGSAWKNWFASCARA
jgi:hypothetical protein